MYVSNTLMIHFGEKQEWLFFFSYGIFNVRFCLIETSIFQEIVMKIYYPIMFFKWVDHFISQNLWSQQIQQ